MVLTTAKRRPPQHGARLWKLLRRRGVDLRSVVLFYWPGDYSRWNLVSAMNYPRTVPIAEDTAELLAAYLESAAQDRRVPLHLSFVAHSLGSLVVLETLRRLRTVRANGHRQGYSPHGRGGARGVLLQR
jgi:integrase